MVDAAEAHDAKACPSFGRNCQSVARGGLHIIVHFVAGVVVRVVQFALLHVC